MLNAGAAQGEWCSVTGGGIAGCRRNAPALFALLSIGCLGGRSYRDIAEIPQGMFVVGCDEVDICGMNSRRVVENDSFCISKHEVTEREYLECAASGGCPLLPGRRGRTGTADEVATLTLSEAAEYCRWRGGRLPTNEEWEIAARGTDERVFSWGSEFSEDRIADPILHREKDVGSVAFRKGTVPAGASPFGLNDVSGTWPEFTRSPSGEVYLRGAPQGFFSADPFDFSVIRVRAAGSDALAAVRCVWSN